MTSTWHVNREYEGIEISFDGKPSEEIRNKMKSVGFKWSSAQMKWYAKDNSRTRQVANELATQGEDVGEHLTFEQYKAVAEGLRKEGKEYEATAIDTLIADLITAQSKPRRKAPERKLKPAIQQLPFMAPEKAPTDYISKLCKQSPLDHSDILKLVKTVALPDVEIAIKIIKECKTLDEFDKFELEELLHQKAQGLEPMKEAKPVHKAISPKPKPETKIRTSREISGKREKEEEKGEKMLPFQAVAYEYHDINLQNAKLFLRDYQQYLPGMLQTGLQKWLETHRTAFKFPLTTHNIDSLSSALQYSIIQPEQKSVRNTVAVQFVSKHAPDILVRGLEKASGNFNWSTVYSYYKDTLKKDLPHIDKFKQDVIGAAKEISFDFG